MKNVFRLFFACALAFAGSVLAGGVASAHTMPESEAMLIYPRAQGSMDITVEFQCGMPLDEVEAVLGSDFDLQDKRYEFRIVRYTYGDISFGAAVGRNDSRPTGEIPVRRIECRSPYFYTPSGFCVGDDYADVVAMYGEGEVSEYAPGERIYTLPSYRSVSFTVDDAGRITEISIGSGDV